MNTQQISTKQISVKRYLPDSSAESYWQQYELPMDDSTSLLDALNHIKEQLDSTLVVPDGDLRLLRGHGEWHSQARLQNLPARL